MAGIDPKELYEWFQRKESQLLHYEHLTKRSQTYQPTESRLTRVMHRMFWESFFSTFQDRLPGMCIEWYKDEKKCFGENKFPCVVTTRYSGICDQVHFCLRDDQIQINFDQVAIYGLFGGNQWSLCKPESITLSFAHCLFNCDERKIHCLAIGGNRKFFTIFTDGLWLGVFK